MATATCAKPDCGPDLFELSRLDILSQGVGHYPETVKPGERGNFSVAGHRITYSEPFNDIEAVQDGDRIVVETLEGYYVYRVVSHEITTPDDVSVIAPRLDGAGILPRQRLITLTTCHPEFSSQWRYIVHGVLDGAYTRDEGLPPDALAPPEEG